MVSTWATAILASSTNPQRGKPSLRSIMHSSTSFQTSLKLCTVIRTALSGFKWTPLSTKRRPAPARLTASGDVLVFCLPNPRCTSFWGSAQCSSSPLQPPLARGSCTGRPDARSRGRSGPVRVSPGSFTTSTRRVYDFPRPPAGGLLAHWLLAQPDATAAAQRHGMPGPLNCAPRAIRARRCSLRRDQALADL